MDTPWQPSQTQDVLEVLATDGNRPSKIAIIAVHGVAKHVAGETQNSIVDLLLSLPSDHPHAKRDYEPFETVGIQTPLQPVLTGKPTSNPPRAKGWLDLYEERSADFAKCLPREAGVLPAIGEVSTKYTDLLLDHYEGGADSNVYMQHQLEESQKNESTEFSGLARSDQRTS